MAEDTILAKANVLCVFDWNRKPRGPKGKKAAFAAVYGDEDNINVGAPRSQSSAGKAYIEAQNRVSADPKGPVKGDIQVAESPGSDTISSFLIRSPNVRSPLFDKVRSNGSTGIYREREDSHNESRHLPIPSNELPRPELSHRGSGESYALSDSGSGLLSGQAPASTAPSVFSQPTGHSSRGSCRSIDTDNGKTIDFLTCNGQYASPRFPSKDYATGYDRVSKASLSAWDLLADSSSHPRSNSISSIRRSQPSAGNSPADRLADSPTYSQSPGGHVAASPRSEGSNFNAYPRMSSSFDRGESRFHDQSMLINRLRPYYSEKDRPFVALAISQFEALDSFEKMIPSRYLFGSIPGSPGRDPPAHVLLALLAFLAHRALLLPDSMNIEDLDLQAGEVVLRCANNYCRLEGEDRKQMLGFARRSWSLANDLMVQKIRSGEVDPRLIMTGMLLEMGAGEDGLSSKGQAQRKMWLFRLVYCWRLHQLDARPDSPSWKTPWDGPEVLQQALEITGGPNGDDPRAPLPRIADARFMIKDVIELEAIRRQISLVVTAAYWIQTSEMQTPKFDIYMLELEPADADDLIHRGSNWTPKLHPASNGYLTQTRDLIFRMYGRINRLLHTPLADICTGHGPESDLQVAITDMETTLDWLMDRVGTLEYDGPEMPLRVAAFIHSRLCVLFMCRLFTSIQAFFYLFPERTTIKADKSLRIASTLMPRDETRSNFDLIAEGAVATELEREDDPSATRDFQGRPLLPRPHFIRQPMPASVAVLWETGAVAKKLLALHRARAAALKPVENADVNVESVMGGEKTGNAVGKTMDASLRAVRWPRHLRMFAQHAYAMAAEAHAAGSSWSTTYGNTLSVSPTSHDGVAQPVLTEEASQSLWDVGDTFLELLEEMAKMGSAHARHNEETTLRYRQERWIWSKQYRAQPSTLRDS